MAEERHLKHAPITEAIIDFRAKLPKDFDVERFAELKDTLHERFPYVEQQRRGAFEIRAGQPPIVESSEQRLIGFLFKSEDGLNIAQFRTDGFTFNRLKPYTEWESVFRDASDMWRLYLEAAAPEFITRIATRYINQLPLPVPQDFSQYLVAPVSIPPGIQGKTHSFLTRIELHEVEENVAANITQALEQSKKPGEIVLRLDIDVYKNQQLEVDDSLIPSYFSSLHDIKNRIFFSSITEEAARCFE